MILLTGFYLDHSASRQQELMQCLRANLTATEIKEIHLFVEEPITPEHATTLTPELRHPKVRLVAHGRRATFADFFAYANTHLAGCPTVVANADIHFDHTLARLREVDLAGRMLCLSRWDLQSDGTARLYEQPASQDAWIFLPPVDIEDCGYHLGTLGCDQRLSWQARHAGLEVSNPSRSVHANHLHLSGVRNYTESQRLSGPYHSIEATYLESPWVWFVVTSRNRLAELQQSLPLLVDQPRSTTILIDYGCQQGSGAWTSGHYGQVVIRYLSDCAAYHGAAARNAGAELADEDALLCFVDVDCRVAPALSESLLQMDARHCYCVPDHAGPGWDNFLAVSRRHFRSVGGLDCALRGVGLEMADLRERLAACGLRQHSIGGALVEHRPYGREGDAAESPARRTTRLDIHGAYLHVKAAIGKALHNGPVSQAARDAVYRDISDHHWANSECESGTVVAFSETMGLQVKRLVPGVSSHVNDERPFLALDDRLVGRQFTQVVASRVSPIRVRFLTPGKIMVLVGTDWDGQWPARAWLHDHGRREPIAPATTHAGTAFEVWSLGGDVDDEYTLPTQVMLVADELVRL